jgi:hypothetical protein
MRKLLLCMTLALTACGGEEGPSLPEKVQFPNDATACLLGLKTAPAQVKELRDKPARDGYIGLSRLAYSQAVPGGEVEAALAAQIKALEAVPSAADLVDDLGPVIVSTTRPLEEACTGLVP